MLRYWLLLFAGLVLPGLLPELPPTVLIACLFLAAGVIALLFRRASTWLKPLSILCLCFITGFSWGLYRAHQLLAANLPIALEREDIWVEGRIISLVNTNSRRVRFVLQVGNAATTSSFSKPYTQFPKKAQISWYRPPAWVRALGTGDFLQLHVRLKRPRGFANPGGFDYQLWQLRRGIGAVGYVRKHADNQLDKARRRLSVRGHLSRWLSRQSLAQGNLMQALLLGDRTNIKPEEWALLQQTGTNHLIAISGLHIGMVAGFAYFLGLWIGRVLTTFTPIRAQSAGFFVAALCAISYAALAGFSLPTERALVMLLLMQWCFWRGRPCSGANIYYSTVLLIVALDPVAIFDAGFWLSFGAVGALIMAGGGRLRVKKTLWQRFGHAQWVVFIGLFIPLVLIYQQVSIVAPLANFIAIPLVSLCVLPALLLAAVFSFIGAPLSDLFLWFADFGLTGLWWWLNILSNAEAQLSIPITFDWAMAPSSKFLALLAALGLLLPRGLGLRPLALAGLVVVLLLPPQKSPPLAMTILDVGQGLAVVIRAGPYTLVYDTGPFYSEHFNAGGGIVAPFLRQHGIHKIDVLIVSHAHTDHSGGASGLLKQVDVKQLYLGEPLARMQWPAHVAMADCTEGAQWQWQSVKFILLPTPKEFWVDGNNSSCVLWVEYQGHQLLLTGDIERDMETYLLDSTLLKGQAIEVLVAPHHGSKTSSSKDFIQALNPAHVVFSTGYKNRHGHPHKQVVKRYQKQGSVLYNTAHMGALEFAWDDNNIMSIVSERIDSKRFWYE